MERVTEVLRAFWWAVATEAILYVTMVHFTIGPCGLNDWPNNFWLSIHAPYIKLFELGGLLQDSYTLMHLAAAAVEVIVLTGPWILLIKFAKEGAARLARSRRSVHEIDVE